MQLYIFVYIGGKPGALGKNILFRTNGDIEDLGAKRSLEVQPGVRLEMSFVFLLV